MNSFCSQERFAELRGRVDRTWRSRPTIKVGSLFSGWGVCEMVLAEIEELWDLYNDGFADYQFQASVFGWHQVQKH